MDDFFSRGGIAGVLDLIPNRSIVVAKPCKSAELLRVLEDECLAIENLCLSIVRSATRRLCSVEFGSFV
jgi:hypothetical protein